MKLLIADDHTLFRDALVQYLERSMPSVNVVTARDFHESMQILAKDSEFDLVVLDLGMPGMGDMDGFRTLKATYPGIPFALMSGIAEPEEVQEAVNLGAVGYFPKTLPGKALVAALQTVLDGQPFIPDDKAKNGFMPSYFRDPPRNKHSLDEMNLTPRETEVLGHLVGGSTNKEIARALSLQVVTVKLHVRGICRKLNAQNRTQAALMAKEMGVKAL